MEFIYEGDDLSVLQEVARWHSIARQHDLDGEPTLSV
jgi:hypothetical protein